MSFTLDLAHRRPDRAVAADPDGGAVRGCAGIGLTIVMSALALAAIRQAATDEQLARWAPECFGTADEINLAALAVTE